MLLLEGYNSNFTCARYYFLYVEFSDFYVNQSLAGQTMLRSAVSIFNLYCNNPTRYYQLMIYKITCFGQNIFSLSYPQAANHFALGKSKKKYLCSLILCNLKG
jgi:hypothetical protein